MYERSVCIFYIFLINIEIWNSVPFDVLQEIVDKLQGSGDMRMSISAQTTFTRPLQLQRTLDSKYKMSRWSIITFAFRFYESYHAADKDKGNYKNVMPKEEKSDVDVEAFIPGT